jgi:hypothetical protein
MRPVIQGIAGAALACLVVGCGSASPTGPSALAPVSPQADTSPYVLGITRVVVRQGASNGPVLAPDANGAYVLRVAGVLPRPAYVMEVYANYAAVSDADRRVEGTAVANFPIGSIFRGIGIGAGGLPGERFTWSFSFDPPPSPGSGYTLTVGFVETRPGTDLRYEVSKVVTITAVP